MDSKQYLQLSDSSPSIQTHLQMIQAVIQRMASNSASCKTWCITIVAAILVVVGDNDKPRMMLLAVLPTALFMILDVYYLQLEKGFRNSYNDFIGKLHGGTLTTEDLYSLKPSGCPVGRQIEAIASFSVWGFYGLLVLVMALAALFIWG